MVMDMLDMSVTLIVKAPNQQIEDQTIKCEPTWTIKKLKGYLSEVYPSKPRTEDQKLIYSGQLLPDSVILRDILRWYEGQEAHTLHLVCAPPRDRRPVNRSQSRMSEKKNTSALGENGVNSGTGGTDAADGLRQRLSSAEVPTSHSFTGNGSSGQFRAPDPGTTWAAAMAQPYGAGYDPNSMVQQLAMMQQAYAHYMAQYMQMLASGAGMPSGLNAQSLHPPQVTVPSPAVPEQVAPPVENQVQEAEAAVENNANILEGEDEARGNRDWLDWFYFMSRLMVLFSIVYFYSSPTRFVIVAALGILMYLCSNTYANTGSEVQLYCFPKLAIEVDRKRRWLQAVN
ncbi:homocysteine-responsive endoplasmic reticulum-resident ubiquitin-like domain member 2 protein isoform X2 [Anabrus simplex]|uniref:homocysteine-responsive endoplasmic reticulum-resident ubiquitin-like domain member 2 protein isoform X2 n=1 Tax=Anabrus simplex TaxID=316456 RepID=UPI0035A34E47